jgi:hypothetical protein
MLKPSASQAMRDPGLKKPDENNLEGLMETM